MSGPAVEGLVLEGELSALTSQLTKVKSVKTKKINTFKKTIERFDVDQNNIELFEAMRQDKKVADDCGDAFIILVEICILKMQKEVDAWTPSNDKQTASPVASKLVNAQDALKAYTADKEELDGKYFALAGSFHARREARQIGLFRLDPVTR